MELPSDPQEVLDFVRAASDAELAAAVHEVGTEVVLGLLFDGMASRFALRPERQPGLLVFALDDDGTPHRHGLVLTPGGATHVPSPLDPPRSTVSTTVVRFLKVAAGAQDPTRLVLTGRMRVRGDAVWAVTGLAGLKE